MLHCNERAIEPTTSWALQTCREIKSPGWWQLVKRKRDVPLGETLEDLRWPGLPRERLERWAAELDLPSLVRDLVARSARFAEA